MDCSELERGELIVYVGGTSPYFIKGEKYEFLRCDQFDNTIEVINGNGDRFWANDYRFQLRKEEKSKMEDRVFKEGEFFTYTGESCSQLTNGNSYKINGNFTQGEERVKVINNHGDSWWTCTTLLKSKKEKRMEALNGILDNVKTGAKQSVVHEGSEVFIDLFKKVAGEEVAAGILKTESGKELIKLVSALAVFYAAKETSLIPGSDNVEAISAIVIQNASRNLVSPGLGELREALSDLAELGSTLSDIES